MNITVTLTAAPELLAVLQTFSCALKPASLVTTSKKQQPIMTEPSSAEDFKQESETSTGEEITLEQVRKVVQAKIQSGKKNQIATLLEEFGARTISKLHPEQFAQFIEQAQAA